MLSRISLRVRTAWALLLAAAIAAGACASPVRVEPADVQAVYSELNEYALNSDRMSDDARVTLERANLHTAFETDPVGTLRRLHALALQVDRRERLYALSELSYIAGERTGDRSLYLASAAYAHLFLFGDADEPPPGPFRRRFRRAVDLYNVGVARAFSEPEDGGVGQFVPAGGRVALPAGSIDVAAPELPVRFGGFAYDDLRPAIGMDIVGFRARDVSSGVGAPLVAQRRAVEGIRERKAHLAPTSAIALTAFLRIEGELEDMEGRGLRATMELIRPAETRRVTIKGQEVPIEIDTTAPLAWELNETRPWEEEVTGFLDKDSAEVDNEVWLTEPYQPGKVPVVFVHGTASSPARWAEILNELHSDARVNANCQFWIYRYGSGAPILVSAAGLRAKLERVVRDVDPEGKDAALRQMVVVGHSQGGLLTRLQVTSSGERFWSYVADVPFDELELSDSERRYMQPVFFFEPSPYVTRVVFLATPHGGSHIAGNWIGKIGSSLVAIPKAVTRGATRLAKRALGMGSALKTEHFSTAVNDMDPDSRFVAALADSPTAPGVPLHSIVAVIDAPEVADLAADGDDGVVLYRSAHLPQAASEVVVDSDHSCQTNPVTVAEIRRILREHLDAIGRK